MKFLRKIGKLSFPKPREDTKGLWVEVECASCGERIRSRIDLELDLTPIYGDRGVTGYYVRKVLVGSSGKCFNPVEVKLTFDAARRLVKKEINGGRFIAP